MELAKKSFSLDWWWIILNKVVTTTSETRWSLDQYDVDYLMNLYEAISLEDYLKSLQTYDHLVKTDAQAVAKRALNLG